MNAWPPKLPKGFPLTLHPRGYMKKGLGWICGKKTPDEALEIYHRKALAAGTEKPIKISVRPGTIDGLAERWLAVKLEDARAGQAARRRDSADAGDETTITFDYYAKCGRAIALFTEHICPDEIPVIGGDRVGSIEIESITPDVFSSFGRTLTARKGRGFAARQSKLVMAMFRHADAEDWIDRPIKFGKRFLVMSRVPRPAKKHPPTVGQVRAVLKHLKDKIKAAEAKRGRGKQNVDSIVQLVAAIYLAINGGYGVRDLSEFPKDPAVVDLKSGVIDYRRGKTNMIRRVPLMPESIEWLGRVWSQREGDDLVFRTREGRAVSREDVTEDDDGKITVSTNDAINQAYSKVLVKLGIKVKGNGFYKLKDLHCTAADECGDDRAARLLTGHAGINRGSERDIRDAYVTVSIERQQRIVKHIRQVILLSPDEPAAAKQNASKGQKRRRTS